MVNGAVRFLIRFVIAAILTLLAIFGEGSAWAKDPTTVVLIVEGGGGDKLRTAIGTDLPAGWTLADSKAVATAAKKRDLPEGLKALDSVVTKGPYLQRVAQVAADVGAKAAVVVYVPKGKTRQAHVAMMSAAGGRLVDTEVPLGAPAEDAATITRTFSNDLTSLGPPGENAPKPEAAPAPAAPAPSGSTEAPPKPAAPPAEAASPAATPAPEASGEPPPWLVAAVSIELANRHLNYRDVVTTNIYSYDSGIAPTPSISLDLFPFAIGRSTTPVLPDLGVFGDFKLGIAKDKSLPSGKASTSWTRFDVGLKYRIWLLKRDWKSLMLAPSLSYGQESFSFKDPAPTSQPLETPGVAYKMLRPRIDARMPIGPIAVQAGVGYLGLLSAGEVAGSFKGTKNIGLEADLAVSLPLGKVFEVRAGFAYRRYSYWFSPAVGDTNIANGAHDQILRGDVGVAVHL